MVNTTRLVRPLIFAAVVASCFSTETASAQIDPEKAFNGLTLWFTKPPVGQIDGKDAYILGFNDSTVRVADDRKRIKNFPKARVKEVRVTKGLSYFPSTEELRAFVERLANVTGHFPSLGTETSEDEFQNILVPPQPTPPPTPPPRSDPPRADPPRAGDPPPPAKPAAEVPAEEPEPVDAGNPGPPELPTWVWAIGAAVVMLILIKLLR